jgi:hypothetical protein
MWLDTKTYWLTDRQSQCDFDFDLAVSRESLQADRQLRVAEAEAEDSSGTQRKGNVHCWKAQPGSTVKAVNTSLCVIVICEV